MTAPLPNIVLAGMMGTGKSAAGRALARLLGRAFLDTDREVERRVGRPIPSIIETDGWEAFRSLEASVMAELAVPRGLVVATGGGALLKEAARAAALAGGTVICLHARPEVLAARLAGQPRPALDGVDGEGGRRERIRHLLDVRAPVYDSFPLRLDSSDLGVDAVADALARLLDLEPVTVRVPGAAPCPVVIRRGLLLEAGVFDAWLDGVVTVQVVADRAPWTHVGPALAASLAAAGKIPRVH
ncbi:MAG: hypothetical protein FJ098_07715, partial [Deltaproteobacteria bacterium]|nr:hypothetical protein [Deltaproteobacteria bacterium]